MTDGTDGAGTAQPTAEEAAIGVAPVAPAGSGAAAVPPLPPSGAPDERPELAVGAAFAGGLALALLLKRMAR